jgi:5'-phosphate synthase pdxT subunit
LKVGVLAVQGSFALHVRSLTRAGVESVEVRKPADLKGLDGIILPGGESTTFHIVMDESGLREPLIDSIRSGLPSWGTCAGAIMLGRGSGLPARWGLIGIDVERNSFGRQVDSFVSPLQIEGFGSAFDGVFIRAPRFIAVDDDVRVLARLDSEPVMANRGKIMVTSFHPELTDDLRVHIFFIREICGGSLSNSWSDSQ